MLLNQRLVRLPRAMQAYVMQIKLLEDKYFFQHKSQDCDKLAGQSNNFSCTEKNQFLLIFTFVGEVAFITSDINKRQLGLYM